MWSGPYQLEPSSTSQTTGNTIAQCCAFQQLGSIPEGDPHPKVAQYRFLCWVILHRTLDLSISKSERLSCPLSRCKVMFQDQQYMELVSHVSSCPYLDQGLYQCPYCNKEESFGWEVPYNFAEKESSATTVNSLTNPYAGHLVQAHPQTALNGSTPQFQQPFELQRESYPEVIVRDQRASRSPNPAMVDSSKRKFIEFNDFNSAAVANESARASDAEYRKSKRQLEEQYMPGMVELPSQNMAARRSSAHMSPRNSPAIMQRNSPAMQDALQMNMGHYNMAVPVVGRDTSPMMSGFGTAEQTAMGVGQMMHNAQAVQIVAPNPAGPGVSPPKGKGRAMSKASSMVPSQTSPQPRQSPGQFETSHEIQSSTHVKSGGSDGGSAGTTEAEKGSVTCKECGKVLRGKVAWLPSNLQRHMREIHLSAPKTECRICGRTFNRGHNLRHHMKAVHGEQP